MKVSKEVKPQEASRILKIGESLRENPKTILLSVPVFLAGAVWFSLTGNRQKLAGSFGHLGITFKNYYKHYWSKKLLLRLAAKSFRVSTKYCPYKDRPAVLLKLGQTWIELGKTDDGKKVLNEAIEIAQKTKDYPMVGYILSHRGHLYISQKQMSLAWKDLKRAGKLIEAGIKKKPEILYYQIWLSGVELENAGYFLQLKHVRKALEWTKKAENRSNKFHLEIRKLDVQMMYKKIKGK